MTTHLITGVGRGIGLALARNLLDRGDRVIGSVRQGGPPLAHDRFRCLDFDVKDGDALARAARAIDEPIDVLVLNAGMMGPASRSTLDADPDAFVEVLAVNAVAPLRVTQAFLPHLRRRGRGRIVAISSQLGGMTYPGSDRIAYRASKSALNKTMQGLAEDLRSEGIAVLVVHPGWVRTEMGGPNAELEPAESAAGLARLIDDLRLETTGRFLDWNGKPRAW